MYWHYCFLVIKTRENIKSIYVSKNTFKRHVDLLLIREEGKRHFVLIKKFKTLMHDHILHHGRKHFCRYCLKAFSAAEILKNHFNNIFKINGKQMIKMPNKGEYVRFNNYERKIKSPFIIYANFESILVPEDNGKQNVDESYRKNIKNMLLAVIGYKLLIISLGSLLSHT